MNVYECLDTYLVIICLIFLVIRVGITHSSRRLKIKNIGDFIPAEFVLIKCGSIIIDLRTHRTNTMFIEIFMVLCGTEKQFRTSMTEIT